MPSIQYIIVQILVPFAITVAGGITIEILVNVLLKKIFHA